MFSKVVQLAVVLGVIFTGIRPQVVVERPAGVAPVDQGEEKCGVKSLHQMKINKEGCTGSVAVFTCEGFCSGEATPKKFITRPSADQVADPFINKCKCCGVLRQDFIPAEITLNCTHNGTQVSHIQQIPVPLVCACTDCLHED